MVKYRRFHYFINACVFVFSRVSPNEPADKGCQGDLEQQTDPEDSPCDTEGETTITETELHLQQIQKDTQVCGRC